MCVDVLVVDDDILEDVETFYVDITTTVPRVAVLMSTATMSVVDDDSVVVTLVRSRLSVEEEMEGGEVEVCVHEIGLIEKEVEVQVFTEEDTAHGKALPPEDVHELHLHTFLYRVYLCIISLQVMLISLMIVTSSNFLLPSPTTRLRVSHSMLSMMRLWRVTRTSVCC